MNYTKNHHLPQWEETDRVLRTDFNQMCADMEAGLNKTASDAASALATVRTEAANAQSSANAAQASADAARTVADAAFCPSYLPYAAGTYTGNGSNAVPTKITLGFRPSLVIITDSLYQIPNSVIVSNVCMAAETNANYGLTILDDGFSVCNLVRKQPELNSEQPHAYVAFR